MQFCSKYGYDYGRDGHRSDEEDYSSEDEDTGQVKHRRIRQADTNIISLRFDELVLSNETFAGEPTKCTSCGAIFSTHSRKNVTNNIWTCEFCETKNTIELTDAEMPKDDDMTFLLEAAAPQPAKIQTRQSSKSKDDNYLTFCIDVSGSMETMIEPKEPAKRLRDISRLEGVKAACIENLTKLRDDEPNKKVLLLTFSQRIKYYGDSSKVKKHQPLIELDMSSGLFEKVDQMIEYSTGLSGEIRSISDTYIRLVHLIKNLCTEGTTALGPALVFSLGFNSRRSGSQIILCTDGAANVGMGAVETAENINEAEQFYEDIGVYAKEKGITVNVISMEGTDCKLALLGKVADRSNGVLSIVNPFKLGDEFRSILENRIIATDVTAKLIVNHKYIYIRDKDLEAAERTEPKDVSKLDSMKKSTAEKKIGNANIETEITFEYGVRKVDDRKETLPPLAFQIQVTYRAPDGSRAMRAYTKKLEFTSDRDIAADNIVEDDLLFAHYANRASCLLLDSDISGGRDRYRAADRFADRHRKVQPAAYATKALRASNLPKRAKMSQLSDQDAAAIYSGSRMSRTQFKK